MCGCLETEQRIHLPNLQILSNMRIFANRPFTHPICQVGVKTLNLPIQHSSSWREGHQVPNMVNLRVLGDTSSFSGLCQIMMEVFHFKTYTSTAHDSLHHILPTLSFWWLRWFICLSRIWFFYFCFFRRDGMLLYLVLKGVLWGKVKCFVTNFISDSECSHGGWGSRERERWLGGWQSWGRYTHTLGVW